MKQTQWGEKEDKSDRGGDCGGASGSVCLCVWKLGQTWGASKCLDAFAYRQRQEGMFGCTRASPWPPNPQAQPSLQGMPQIWLSGSLRGRASSASRFNMLCVPTLPRLLPPLSLPLHLNYHCPWVGPSPLVSRSLLKAPFKPRRCLWIRGKWRDEEGMRLKIANCNFRYVYSSRPRILIHSGLFALLSSHCKCMHARAFIQFFFSNLEAFVFYFIFFTNKTEKE